MMDRPSSPPLRRLSSLLPKPTTDVLLPSLEDAVGAIPVDQLANVFSNHTEGTEVPRLVIPGVTQFLLDGNPIQTYIISGTPFNMEQPINETRNEFRRYTCDRRRLRYTLEVIQQPDKARACGAGPRSSADRRPVDPPPVVQLTIFDETNGQDITMAYDAGFMLYASLEVARPIANGRIHSAPTMPVLTGVAVASTAYLDRPKPAGYFIFPDLSVRHEGWYRLKFSLFEAIKQPADADEDRPFVRSDPASEGIVLHESMANRLQVLSTPFQVFSAKKFPGLNMSTNLSKVVADQGCRVRIRREIRQRKRNEDKPGPEVSEDGRTSYRGSPEMSFAKPSHVRTMSRNSIDNQYSQDRPLRQPSIDSLYGRPPGPSRNPSIASLTMPSPTTPSVSQMMPMAPPSAFNSRHSVDMSPLESKQYAVRIHPFPPTHPYSQIINSEPEVRLPPINCATPLPAAPRNSLYSLPEPSPSKRSYSPNVYDQNSSMKSGARPDNMVSNPQANFSAPNGDVIIEADTDDGNGNDDGFCEGPMTYIRANGTKGFKNFH